MNKKFTRTLTIIFLLIYSHSLQAHLEFVKIETSYTKCRDVSCFEKSCFKNLMAIASNFEKRYFEKRYIVEIWETKQEKNLGTKELEEKKTVIAKLKHNAPISSLAWHPHIPNRIATATNNGQIYIWNTNKPKKAIQIIKAHGSSITCIKWGYKGELASASEDKTIKIWQLGKHQSYETLTGYKKTVASIDWIRNEKSKEIFLASTSHDGSIKIWSISNEKIELEADIVNNKKNCAYTDVAWRPWNANTLAFCSVDLDGNNHALHIFRLDIKSMETIALDFEPYMLKWRTYSLKSYDPSFITVTGKRGETETIETWKLFNEQNKAELIAKIDMPISNFCFAWSLDICGGIEIAEKNGGISLYGLFDEVVATNKIDHEIQETERLARQIEQVKWKKQNEHLFARHALDKLFDAKPLGNKLPVTLPRR